MIVFQIMENNIQDGKLLKVYKVQYLYMLIYFFFVWYLGYSIVLYDVYYISDFGFIYSKSLLINK